MSNDWDRSGLDWDDYAPMADDAGHEYLMDIVHRIVREQPLHAWHWVRRIDRVPEGYTVLCSCEETYFIEASS